MIGAERAAHTALLPARSEHEMRHNELAPVLKKIGQALSSAWAIENIVFLDLYPGQGAALGREGALRVTYGTPEENERFLEALAEVL